MNAFGSRMDSRKFESLLNGWHIDPTPSSVREEWASSETRRGGYNATSYRSAAFDAVIDSAVKEMDPNRRCPCHVALRSAERQRSLEADSTQRDEIGRVVGQSRGVERQLSPLAPDSRKNDN